MTLLDRINARIQSYSRLHGEDRILTLGSGDSDISLLIEAAAEIERQAAMIATLERKLDDLQQELEAIQAERNQFLRERDERAEAARWLWHDASEWDEMNADWSADAVKRWPWLSE